MGTLFSNASAPQRLLENGANQLVAHIRSMPEFKAWTQIDGNYGHLGATLADAALQINNNYERNVRPRVARIRRLYGDYVSRTDLQRLLQTVTPQEFLNWNGTRKPKVFLDLVDLLASENVDTEVDLKSWLLLNGTREKLIALRFVGQKTADYLKILVGLPAAAVDRHLIGFLAEAGLNNLDYRTAQEIIHRAADLMDIDRSHLDHSIWRYMSGRDGPPNPRRGSTDWCLAGPRRHDGPQ